MVKRLIVYLVRWCIQANTLHCKDNDIWKDEVSAILTLTTKKKLK
jgi:hypothetical protein